MITIPINSEAGTYLARAVSHPGTHKVSFDIRENGVAIKRNEGMWTPTLSIKEDA